MTTSFPRGTCKAANQTRSPSLCLLMQQQRALLRTQVKSVITAKNLHVIVISVSGVFCFWFGVKPWETSSHFCMIFRKTWLVYAGLLIFAWNWSIRLLNRNQERTDPCTIEKGDTDENNGKHGPPNMKSCSELQAVLVRDVPGWLALPQWLTKGCRYILGFTRKWNRQW